MIDPDLLLQGYRLGVFPMAMNDDSIEWFSPDPRAVLPLENFHVPHSLRNRCVQDRARGARGTFARPQLRPARHAMAHAPSATIWRDPNFAEQLSAPVAESSRFAAEISVAHFQCFL